MISSNISPAALVISVSPQGTGSEVMKAAKDAFGVGGFIIRGQGTASEDIWERLGITKYREIVLCTTVYHHVDGVMHAMAGHSDYSAAGSGIVFAVSIEKLLTKSMMNHVVMKTKEAGIDLESMDDEQKAEIKQKVAKSMQKMHDEKIAAQEDCPYELVLVRMAHGFGQDVMDTARKAGARGGTVVHGRACLDAKAVKFFNITIEPESDILFMLVLQDKTDAILDAIAAEWGPKTPAHAFGFVLPVVKTFGMLQEAAANQ